MGVLGGLAGVLGSGVAFGGAVLLVDTTPEGPVLRNILLIATLMGFAVGGLLAPISTWLFLRRVPLWRASGETAFFAALVFTAVLMMGSGFLSAIVAGSVAALIAAARLHRAFRLPKGSASPNAPTNERAGSA